jgi:hypothetical protein
MNHRALGLAVKAQVSDLLKQKSYHLTQTKIPSKSTEKVLLTTLTPFNSNHRAFTMPHRTMTKMILLY